MEDDQTCCIHAPHEMPDAVRPCRSVPDTLDASGAGPDGSTGAEAAGLRQSQRPNRPDNFNCIFNRTERGRIEGRVVMGF